jgi:hypothetical protein
MQISYLICLGGLWAIRFETTMQFKIDGQKNKGKCKNESYHNPYEEGSRTTELKRKKPR